MSTKPLSTPDAALTIGANVYWTIPASKFGTDALTLYPKHINGDVMRLSQELAIARCKLLHHTPTITRRDVEKAICQVHQIPLAELIIVQLIHTIPVLSRKMGPDWSTKDFDAFQFHAALEGWSAGERLAGLFVLNVWNPGLAKSEGWHFNVFDAVGTLGSENILPIALWMANPQWP